MSNQQRKVAKLAATFMVTTLSAVACSAPEVSKNSCHIHGSDKEVRAFEGRHCHKAEKPDHKHAMAMIKPPKLPSPPISGNPAPPPKPPKLPK